MNKRRRLRNALADLVLVLGAVVTLAAPAAASSPPCWTTSCLGHDPAILGCPSSTVTSSDATLNGAVLAILWNKCSVLCKAIWSSAELTQAAIKVGDALYVKITTTGSAGKTETMCFPGPGNKGWQEEDCAGFPNDGYCCSGFPYTDLVDGAKTTYSEVDVTGPDKLIIASAFTQQ